MTLWQIPVFRETCTAPSRHVYHCPHTWRYHMYIFIFKPFQSYLKCFWDRGCIGSEGGHVNAVICLCIFVCMSVQSWSSKLYFQLQGSEEWIENSIIYCLDTLCGNKFGPKMKSVYCDVSSINWHQSFGRAYENTFQLMFLLFLLTFVYSVFMWSMQSDFNIFKCFLYCIVFCSKIWVFKWVLGQESHPYTLCLGITFQGQN